MTFKRIGILSTRFSNVLITSLLLNELVFRMCSIVTIHYSDTNTDSYLHMCLYLFATRRSNTIIYVFVLLYQNNRQKWINVVKLGGIFIARLPLSLLRGQNWLIWTDFFNIPMNRINYCFNPSSGYFPYHLTLPQ